MSSFTQLIQRCHAEPHDKLLVATQLSAYYKPNVANEAYEDIEAFYRVNPHIITHQFVAMLLLQQAQCAGNSYIDLTSLVNNQFFEKMDSDNPTQYATENGQSLTGAQCTSYEEIEMSIQALIAHPIHGQLLVIDKQRLFSRKVYEYEQFISQQISQKITTSNERLNPNVKTVFEQLYPSPIKNIWQAMASVTALNQSFFIINGGPGTGKTYTVIRTLLLHLAQADKRLNFALCAPTGKAAQRMSESIVNEVQHLSRQGIAPELLANIPTTASTVHRLLGLGYHRNYAKYHQGNPLPHDVLVIDEASMLDTRLMFRILSAVKPSTRILLIGDTAQLPSVESGNILKDVMPVHVNQFSSTMMQWVESVSSELSSQYLTSCAEIPGENSQWNDYAATLLTNMRSTHHVNELANAIYQNNVNGAITALDNVITRWSTSSPKLSNLASSTLLYRPDEVDEQQVKHNFNALIKTMSDAYFKPLLSTLEPTAALALLRQFRILSPIRHSAMGIEGINKAIDQLLDPSTKKSADPDRHLYHGKAILITQNDMQLGIYNGDSGVILRNEAQQLTAYIDRGDQAPLAISPYRIAKFQSAYAMTIHKTQGSEFDQVLIVLPSGLIHPMSKELLYTGITRAKQYVAVTGATSDFVKAIYTTHARHTNIVIEPNKPCLTQITDEKRV